MTIRTPEEILAVLTAFDSRGDMFTTSEVERGLFAGVKDTAVLAPEARHGAWVEWAAFALRASEGRVPQPRGTYFRPWFGGEPDLRKVDSEILDHWCIRAKSMTHPVLVARYADLVWDISGETSGGLRPRAPIDLARLAIDNYIAASRADSGSARGDTHENLGRALVLALSIRDAARVDASVSANIEYVDRTSDDEQIGTYCYLFDHLLPGKNGPPLTVDQERMVVAMFEGKFSAMQAPSSRWYAEHHGPLTVGRKLVDYYQRKSLLADRNRILRSIAEAVERKAAVSDPLVGVLVLDHARRAYLEAGLREEAERIQTKAESLGREAEMRMETFKIRHEISNEEKENYLTSMMGGGLEVALGRFAARFVPRHEEIVRHLEQCEGASLAGTLVPLTKMAHGRIVAQLGDETADPDGTMVHEVSEYASYASTWISWVLDRMISDGLTGARGLEYIKRTPIFTDDRHPLLERGIDAHIRGQYAEAVHLLLPQLEHAVRTLTELISETSASKQHRTGRGVMQAKTLNDLLDKEAWPVLGEGGEDFRIYLLSMLAHPKGLNIRNEVAHGLWPYDAFHKGISERVLHVLFAVASVRTARKQDGTSES